MRNVCVGILSGLILFFGAGFVQANNVAVSDLVLQNKDTDTSTIEVKFTLSQDNTFSGTDANGNTFYDKIWIFVKYWVTGDDSETTGWHHATLCSGGTVTPTSDGKGAFCSTGADQVLKWSYGSDGVSGSAIVKVTVNAIEMVYIPEGSFVYNVSGDGGSTYNNYGSGSQTNVTGAVSAAGDGTDTTHGPNGCAIGWPNGYSAFYLAKYEVSQGQYADFLNMIAQSDGTSRFPDNLGNNRHTISYTSSSDYGSRYSASSPNRSCNYLSWDDCRAYASWCGLRPITEMEFEKAARGGGTSNTNVYPWGDTDPTTTTYTFDSTTISQYYANFNNTSFGPVDAGHYLSQDIARTNAQTGASVYGVTDLAGNNWEHLINCAHTNVPANGTGTCSWPASWPDPSSGKGLRGGRWSNSFLNLRVSDRVYAGWTNTVRYSDMGFRPARTE